MTCRDIDDEMRLANGGTAAHVGHTSQQTLEKSTGSEIRIYVLLYFPLFHMTGC